MKTIEKLYKEVQRTRKAYDDYLQGDERELEQIMNLSYDYCKAVNDYEYAVWSRL